MSTRTCERCGTRQDVNCIPDPCRKTPPYGRTQVNLCPPCERERRQEA